MYYNKENGNKKKSELISFVKIKEKNLAKKKKFCHFISRPY